MAVGLLAASVTVLTLLCPVPVWAVVLAFAFSASVGVGVRVDVWVGVGVWVGVPVRVVGLLGIVPVRLVARVVRDAGQLDLAALDLAARGGAAGAARH